MEREREGQEKKGRERGRKVTGYMDEWKNGQVGRQPEGQIENIYNLCQIT